MAQITKLAVDVNNEKVVISATSSGKVVDTVANKIYHHKFTKVIMDNSTTFNCSNSPSVNAVSFNLNKNYDENLSNEEIAFNSIPYKDISNELLFVWLEETKYVEQYTVYEGFVVDSDITNYLTLYFTDGTKYYRVSYEDPENIDMSTFEDDVTSETFKTEKESASSNYNVLGYREGVDGKYYIKIVEGTNIIRYNVFDLTEKTVDDCREIDYTNTLYKIVTNEDNPTYIFGVTLSVSTLYQLLFNRINIASNSCCKVECSDVNTMLAWQGFNLAKNLGEYKQMVKYWKILHRTTNLDTSTCGCSH